MARPRTGVARGVLVSTIGNLAPVIAGLLTAPILAQNLGVSGRGELAAATAPFLLAMGAATFGIPDSITYHVARGVGGRRSMLAHSTILMFIAGTLSTLIVFTFSGPLSGNNSALASLMTAASLAITPGLMVGAARGAAAGHEWWTLIAAEKGLAAAIRLIAILLLFMTGTLSPFTATLVIGGTSVIGGVVYVALLRRQPPRPASSSGAEPRLLRFGLGQWVGTLAGVILSRIDQIVMVPLSGVYMLGIYAVAVTISEVVLVFNRAVRDVVFAAESGEGRMDRLSQASRISTLVTTVGAIGVGVVSLFVIPWLFGSAFAPAIPVTIILLVAVVLGNPGSVAGAGLSARGKPLLRSLSLALAAAVNIAALVLLIPTWGAVGAAWATVIGNIVAGYANIVWIRFYYKARIWDFVGVRRGDIRDAYLVIRRARRRKLATSS